jgi:hypothetical protein
MSRFRLVAPYDPNPEHWLKLPWVDLATGKRHAVTTIGIPSPEVVLLRTYREVLARYAVHPEPKSLDPDGKPCSRRSPPGLLSRRPVTMLTLSLIGKESNRLDEIAAGLIGTLDDALSSYGDPGITSWGSLVVPALHDFSTREVADRAGLDTRTIERIKSRAISRSHDRNRAVLTSITAQLACQRLETWGVRAPSRPLEQIASYLDKRDHNLRPLRCIECAGELASRRQRYCSATCKKRAYRKRRPSVRDLRHNC